MKNETVDIPRKINELRKGKNLTQAQLDKLANLPATTIAKMEKERREITALELARIAKALSVSINIFFLSGNLSVSTEELDVVLAMRTISFLKYKRILKTLEADIYFKSKDVSNERKKKMNDLVTKLSNMSLFDQRPRGHL